MRRSNPEPQAHHLLRGQFAEIALSCSCSSASMSVTMNDSDKANLTRPTHIQGVLIRGDGLVCTFDAAAARLLPHGRGAG